MGRLRTSPMSEGEKNDILTFLKSGKTIKEAAYTFGRDPSAISKLLAKLRPTTELARVTLQSRAMEMVDRVLAKADVDQMLAILQNPTVGVLEPPPSNKAGAGAGPGVLINIQAGSLAAVNEGEFIEGQKVAPPQLTEGGAKNIQIGSVPVGQLYEIVEE